MLEIRLNILDERVDKFIIVECTETFSGVPKDLCFNIEDERWAKWKNKIIYYVVDDFPLDSVIYNMSINSPCTGNKEHYWVREFYLKESARKALEGLKDSDIVFISDLDEIWNPALTYHPIGNEVLKPRQLPYLYYLNQRTDEDWLGWSGTICVRYKTIKDGIINHLRNDDMTQFTVLDNGGWHFCSIGGKQKKMEANKNHPIVNDMDFNRREVNMRKDDSQLPDYLKTTWKQFQL